MISFSCPSCSQPYTVNDTKAGMTAKCKRCGEPVRVPGGMEPDWNNGTVQRLAHPERTPSSQPGPRLPPRGLWYAVGAAGLLTLLSVLYLGLSGGDARSTPTPGYTPATPVVPRKSDEDRATEVVRLWLDELKAGGDGSSFWLASNTLEMHHLTSIRPYAVRGYDIQSVRPLQVEPSWAQTGAKRAVAVRFRVDHSGAGGQPVTNEYRVTVFDLGGGWVLGDGARR